MVKKLIPLILVAALAIGAGFYFFNKKTEAKSEPQKLYGNVEIREVELGFRQSGRIRQLYVDEGDKVTPGQRLGELDTDTFENAVQNVDAQIYSAGAELNKLENGSRKEDIKAAAANLEQTKFVLKNAETEYQRQLALLPTGAVAQKVVDAAKTQRDVAKANLDAATEAFDLRKNGSRKEDIEAGKGKLYSAQAQKKQLVTALNDTVLVAPSSGTIISREKEIGSIVQAGTPIYTLSLNDKVYIRAYAPETLLAKLAPGTMLELKNDSSNKIYHGQVAFVSPRAEFTPKSVETASLRTDLVYRLRILVTDTDGSLLQGMPVTISLPQNVAKDSNLQNKDKNINLLGK